MDSKLSLQAAQYWDKLVNREPTFFDVNVERYISIYRSGTTKGVRLDDIEIRKLNLMRALIKAVVVDDKTAINGINLCIKARFPDIEKSYPVGFGILERYGYKLLN